MLGSRWFLTFFLTTFFAGGMLGGKATARAKWSACKPVESATFAEQFMPGATRRWTQNSLLLRFPRRIPSFLLELSA